ncbi:MAG: peroxiredoxin family protein [Actinomycetota bacterium]|nr:peroxiredoxin family protein [Actinomycetota bacterium]
MDPWREGPRIGFVVWVIIGFLGVALLAAWGMILQLVGQQGRILLRLEQLEQSAATGSSRPGSTDGAPRGPGGIPLATAFPAFRLPDLNGETLSLEGLRGERVLLVHWDPRCGFCRQIAGDLASLRGDLRERKTELMLVSHGDAESNRRLAEEHGLDCPILLQPDDQPIEGFATLGTPAAYLLDEKGRVAKPLALGASEVPALARAAARARKRLGTERSLAESRIEREGVPAGSAAPDFELPDLGGRPVSLADYRGRRVLLVFSDPDCGPCGALATELARFHEEHRDDGLDIVMVTRGGMEENRRRAEEHGIDFPVVVQPGWKLSKEYGIFATPVAFLVDERGRIARVVAKGGPEILGLAHGAVSRGEGARMA